MIRIRRTNGRRFWRLQVCLLAFVVGCAPGGVRLEHDIEFEGTDGSRLFQLEPDREKVELEDAQGRDVADFRYRGSEIAFEDANGRPLEVLSTSDNGLLMRDRDTRKILYRFQPEPDGDYDLEDATGQSVYRVKWRNYGFKVIDGLGKELKVRLKRGKISVRDRSGKTILSSRDLTSPLAASCFCFSSLPLEMQAAMCLGVLYWGLDAA